MLEIKVDAKPKNKISPYLYMQFMEPLGAEDSSVEAGWDFLQQGWKPELIDLVKKLNPGCIRWGGCFTSYWKWREGVGPRNERTPIINDLWGGQESNQVGVHEFIEFCKLTGAEPLLGINFAADGRPEYINTALGEKRAGTAQEAADLVSYCNDPDNPERIANGVKDPWNLKLWQIGNETSYPKVGKRFTAEENAKKYLEFAKAMKEVDPDIKLTGWGGQERDTGDWWIKKLTDMAGDQIDYVAFHMMNQHPQRSDTILTGMEYMKDREQAWVELLEIYDLVEAKLNKAEGILKEANPKLKLAITEGHLTLKPHNQNFILNEWLSGLYHAKVMNLYERHSDMIEIATLADFFGNRWTVNALTLGRKNSYLMPVGIVMKLFKRYVGENNLSIPAIQGKLDLAASRTDNKVFLHVVNTDFYKEEEAEIVIPGYKVKSGTVHQIATDISTYVDEERPDAIKPEEYQVTTKNESAYYTFPAASVSAIELDVEEA